MFMLTTSTVNNYTIAIKLSIFLYDPDFRNNENYFEFWVLFDMYTGYQLWIISISFIYNCPRTGSLRLSAVQELICKNGFLLMLSNERALNAYVG